MVNCQTVNPDRGEYYVQFNPQYGGSNGNPISFSVVNEMAPTTQAGPYILHIYNDNSIITLVANQMGNNEARYSYNWLASCQSGSSFNEPPTTTGIPSQTILQGQPYQLNVSNYFSDPYGQALTYTISGLPGGLTASGSLISGAPSATGIS